MKRHIGKRIGYARVSSTDQNLERQRGALGDVDRLFEEKQSGAGRSARTALAELISYARDGDTVVVSSMDRLARSVVDLNQIVAELVAKDVVVEFLAERVTFRPGAADPFAEFQLTSWARSLSSSGPSPRSVRLKASAPRRPAASTPAVRAG